MVDQRLKITRQAFSDSFVGYVLNVATDALDSLEVSAVQAKCLDELYHYALGVLQTEDNHQRIAVQSLLLGPSSSADIGVASMMRKGCGGELPSTESDDEVERLLLACVRDAYPILLMPIPTTIWPFPDIHLLPGLLKLEAAKQLRSAILIDDDLRRLFPRIPENEVGQVSFLPFWQTGIGNEHQASEVPKLLVSYSLTMSAIYGELTQQACARFAREALMFARSLARGEHVSLPVIIGISGIELADDLDSIDVTCGELRRSTPPALAHFGWRAKEWDIKTLLVLRAKDKIVEVGSWESGHGPTPDEMEVALGKLHPKMEQAYRDAETLIARVRYSLLLGSGADELLATRAGVMSRLNPLESGTQTHLISGSPDLLPTAIITKATAVGIEMWARRVAEEHPKSLDIGVRRLLLAASMRLDPMDGFIDAVMCWENLFGDAQEAGLKVCGSLAVLLEPEDSRKREILFSELKKLYDTRSRLVHGAAEPSIQVAHQNRNRALTVALQAMRATYGVPGLLAMSGSVARYKRVLLGFPAPPTQPNTPS